MNKTQKGFALIEGLLIILILAIIGFGGYYVWHNRHATETVTPKSVTAASSAPASTQKYLTITEWGVRAPYSGTLSLSYKLDSSTATADFSSAQLTAAANGGCQGYGGHIQRLLPNDAFTMTGETAAQAANDSSYTGFYKLVDGYYYFFVHDQALCPDITDANSNAADLQGKTSDVVKALIPNLQAIPQ